MAKKVFTAYLEPLSADKFSFTFKGHILKLDETWGKSERKQRLCATTQGPKVKLASPDPHLHKR